MSDGTSSRGGKKPVHSETRTATGIGAEEEKVVRMRHGLVAPDRLELSRVGQDDPEVAARLLEIEMEAYRKAGRIDTLRRDVGLEDRPESDGKTKSKIIAQLQSLEEET